MTYPSQCGTDLAGQASCPSSKSCFWKKYCSFKGRASRSEFWLYILTAALVLLAFSFFMAPRIFDLVVYRRLLLLLGATTFLPILSVTIRRYHDVGLSSWIFGAICLWSVAQGVWVVDEIIHRGFISLFEYFPLRWFLAVSISFLLGVFNLFVASWPGTKGPNKYGSAPEKRARKKGPSSNNACFSSLVLVLIVARRLFARPD